MTQWSLAKQGLIAGVLLVIGAVLWQAQDAVRALFATEQTQGRKRGGGGDRAVPVLVATVKSREDRQVVTVVGTGRALRSVTLFPDVDGVVEAVAFSAGDRVKEGQLLFQLNQNKAKLGVEVARSALATAQRGVDRSKFLRKRNVGSDARVDDATAALELARVQVLQAEEALRDTRLLAPFAGITGIPNVDSGTRVTTSTELVTLDDRSELLVQFEVPERFLARLATGLAITARTPGYPQRLFEGAIRYIDTRVDATARTVKVRAAIENADDLLRPGLSFALELALPGETYVAVPELALQYDNGQSFVWAVGQDGDTHTARKVSVAIERRMNSQTLVSGELKSGDVVVVEGVQRLRPGRAVRFLADAPSKKQKRGGRSSGSARETSKADDGPTGTSGDAKRGTQG